MRKKHSLMLTVLICIFSIFSYAQIPCDKLPPRPSPATAVNDFANIIDPGTKSSLETALRKYYDSTSISLVVVTVPTIGDYDHDDYATYLFRCWGIGDKETNRGILLFVALQERKIVVRLGYGMEEFIPDLNAGHTIDVMRPFFKDQQYSEGIVAGVQDIIKNAGTMTWKDRVDGIQKKKDARDKRIRDIMDTVLNVAYVIIFIALVILLVVQIRKRVLYAKEKKKILAAMADTDKEIATAEQMVKDTYAATSTAPKWVQEEAKMHQVLVTESIEEAKKKLSGLYEEKKINIEYAKRKLYEVSSLLQKASGGYRKLENDLCKKMITVGTEAPVRLKQALQIVNSNIVIIASYIKKGYRFNDTQHLLEQYKELLETYEKNLDDRESLLVTYTKSLEIAQKSEDAVKGIRDMVVTAQQVTKGLAELQEEVPKLCQMKDKYENMIVSYKAKYPASIWQEHEATMQHALLKLQPSALQQKIAVIQQANSMEQQNFAIAKKEYDSLVQTFQMLSSTYEAIVSIEVRQQNAKKLFKERYESAKESVDVALAKTKDSDVSKKTKNAAKAASKKLEEAKTDSGLTLVDWVIIISLLDTIDADAKDASAHAVKEIKAAKEEREAESYNHSYSSGSYLSTSNFGSYSSGFSSGGGGGFGGFGGGSTGGGGASGGW